MSIFFLWTIYAEGQYEGGKGPESQISIPEDFIR